MCKQEDGTEKPYQFCVSHSQNYTFGHRLSHLTYTAHRRGWEKPQRWRSSLNDRIDDGLTRTHLTNIESRSEHECGRSKEHKVRRWPPLMRQSVMYSKCGTRPADSLSPRICLRRTCFMKASSDVSHYLIGVLVADSNLTQSQLLSSALRRKPGIKVNCCRGELPDCVQALRSVPVDVALLGGGATDHKQLDTLRSLHASHPQVGLILLVDSYDRNLVVNAMRAGARGLFCRACQPFQALSRCISVVHQGQFWANTEQLGYVIEALRSAPQARVINAKGEYLLTPR